MMRINDNGIDRDMTPQELAAYNIFAAQLQAEAEAAAQAAANAAAAKQSARAKLAILGLTDKEIDAMVGA